MRLRFLLVHFYFYFKLCGGESSTRLIYDITIYGADSTRVIKEKY